MTAKKKKLVKFKMNEISAVDKPAQEGAVALIMKRDVSKSQVKAVITAPDDSGHSHIVWLDDNVGTTSYSNDEGGEGHNHPYVVNPDGTVRIAEADGHTHEIDSDELATMLQTIAMARLYENTEHYDAYKSIVKYSAFGRDLFAQAGSAMRDGSFPIVEKSDIDLALKAFEKAANKKEVAKHIATRANALGVTKELTILKSFLSNPALTKGAEQLEGSHMAESNKPAENGVEVLTKRIEQLETSLLKADAFGKLNDQEKAFYAGLDTKAQEAFIAKSDSERKAQIELSKADNAVVYTADDGTEFRKNDDQRLVKMAKENDENRRELAKAREEKENSVLEKRAETELQYLPGDVKTRAAILKSVEGIKDEATRKAALDVLKAQNEGMSKAFKETGTSVVNEHIGNASKELDNLAKNYAKEHSVSYLQAYEFVKNQNIELYKRALNGG